jgi:hypothetical protein
MATFAQWPRGGATSSFPPTDNQRWAVSNQGSYGANGFQVHRSADHASPAPLTASSADVPRHPFQPQPAPSGRRPSPSTSRPQQHYGRTASPRVGSGSSSQQQQQGRSGSPQRHPNEPFRFIHEGRLLVHRGSVFDKLTDPSLYTGTHKCRFDAQGRGRGLDGHDSFSVYAAENTTATREGEGAPYGGDDRDGNRWSTTLRSTFYSRTVDERSRARREQREHERHVAEQWQRTRRAINTGDWPRPPYEDGSEGGYAEDLAPTYEQWALDPTTGLLVLEEHHEPQPVAPHVAPSAAAAPAWPASHSVAAHRGAPQASPVPRTAVPLANPHGPAHGPLDWERAPESFGPRPASQPIAMTSVAQQPYFEASTKPPPRTEYAAELLHHAASVAQANTARDRTIAAARNEEFRVGDALPPRPMAEWERRALGFEHPPSVHDPTFDAVRRELDLAAANDYDPRAIANAARHGHLARQQPQQRIASGAVASDFQHVDNDRRRWIDDAHPERPPTIDELMNAVEAQSRFASR